MKSQSHISPPPLNNNNNSCNHNTNNNNNNSSSNIKNLIASSAGSILTSLIVTPLDVVKVRQQTQQAKLPPKSVLQTQFCKQHRKSYRFHFQKKHVFNNTLDAFKKIYKNEGIFTFWRGFLPSISMIVPNTAIYFTSYEYIKGHLYKYGSSEEYAIYTVPLIAGSLARIISATATSPLELLRTNSQGITKNSMVSVSNATLSSNNHHSASSICRVSGCSANVCSPVAAYSTIRITQQQNFNSISLFKDIIKAHGFPGLYRSLLPTLVRDVPFSSLYWMGYEVLKNKFMKLKYSNYQIGSSKQQQPQLQQTSPFIINFTAGAIAGSFAAAITTPIDVIKSRVSMSVLNHNHTNGNVNTRELSSVRYQFKQILKEEGLKGLCKGLSARVTKISAACGIMISTFEWIKQSNFN